MESKKANFKRISENRTNKILLTIQQLGNLTNTSYYEYTKEDIENMFNLIEEKLCSVKERLIENIEKGDRKFEL